MTRSIFAAGVGIALVALGAILLGAEHFVFAPYAQALQRQVVVTVAPVEWHMAAYCPRCGNEWRVDGGTR